VYITTPEINAPATAADQGLIIGVSFVSSETLLTSLGPSVMPSRSNGINAIFASSYGELPI
jgi:hypothetical protein